MKRFLSYIVLLFCVFFAFGQHPERNYIEHRELSNALEVRTNHGIYLFKPFGQNIIETAFIPQGETLEGRSHAVVLNPSGLRTVKNEITASITYGLAGAGLKVKIQKKPFKISYEYKGEEMISEKRGFVQDSLRKLEFNLDATEVLYGGGARALGMNRRGNRLPLYNRAHYGYEERSELLNYTMPLVLSSKKYLVHFDNAPIGFLDLDSQQNNTLTYETISGRMVYQVIAGSNWYQLIDDYTELTGKQPMIPRWALGNFSSRFGYHSEAETRATVDKFIEDSIPVDAVVLDLFWFGKDIKGHMGGFEFVKDSFPTPAKMIADFKQKGVKTVLISEPFILSTSKKWDEAVEKKVLGLDSIGNPYRFDFYFGNSGIVDIYKPAAREWFWNIYKDLTETYKVDGWWGDLGEPEAHPSELLHETGTADEVHNTYGHDWARMIYNGYIQDFPKQRPFILMRAGYSGSQHYGMIPWSGDVNRSWGGFRPQPEIALQMGMQGLGFMHSDLGGFAGDYKDDELYIRWLQYGVFQPIYRPHAQESVPSEPVFKSEKTKALAKKAIELRYQMLPYNYTLAFENHMAGVPLMRPMFFEEEDSSFLEKDRAFFWGKDLLIFPVMEKGQTAMEITLPKSTNWFDFFTGEQFEGNSTFTVKLEEDRIPVFVRADRFIPMAPIVQSTDLYSTEKLILHYYCDVDNPKAKGYLYDDDGKTSKAYEKGQFEMVEFTSSQGDGYIYLDMESKPGKAYNAPNREIEMVVFGFDKEPRRARANNRKLDLKWNQAEKSVTFTVTLEAQSKTYIEIKK